MKNTIIVFLLWFLMCPDVSVAQSEGDVKLPEPRTNGGMPLMEALNNRHSTREYTEQKLPMDLLSNLLWAADGYNRRDAKKRTAPSSMNFQEIDIYVAMQDGLYIYDAWDNKLILVMNKDLRDATGKQDFVGKAALNLVYVANLEKVKDPESEGQLNASHTNAGFIAQNVYLFCASEGLGSVVRGWFDEKSLSETMKLGEKQKIILCQTVGYPEK